MNVVHKKVRGRPRKDETSRGVDRQAMIDAAVDIVRASGSAGLTARSVAEAAGVAVGSVYTQFDNLEALRFEVNAVTIALLREALTRAMEEDRDASTRERLFSLARAYLAFAEAHRNVWITLFDKRTMAVPAEIAADIEALFSIIEEILRDARPAATGQIPVMARALWSSVHGMVYLADTGGLGPIKPHETAAMIEALVGAVVKGLVVER